MYFFYVLRKKCIFPSMAHTPVVEGQNVNETRYFHQKHYEWHISAIYQPFSIIFVYTEPWTVGEIKHCLVTVTTITKDNSSGDQIKYAVLHKKLQLHPA